MPLIENQSEWGILVMKTTEKLKGTVITGVVGEDVHIVGITVLGHALRKAGFNVVALGAQVPQEDFIGAAIETKADAILVSSLGGHAKELVQEFKDKCFEAGLGDIRLYIGGHLVIGETRWEDVEKLFKRLGFNRVYPPGVSMKQVVEDLESDLKGRN
jgi:methylaspartate mutase sigma subunit